MKLMNLTPIFPEMPLKQFYLISACFQKKSNKAIYVMPISFVLKMSLFLVGGDGGGGGGVLQPLDPSSIGSLTLG